MNPDEAPLSLGTKPRPVDRPLWVVPIFDPRFLILYVGACVLMVVATWLVVTSNHRTERDIHSLCVAANLTADVWNGAVARSIRDEQTSTDTPQVKARKIASLRAFNFPKQDCR